MSRTETRDQFVVMLGGCYDAARLTRAWMRLELDDGTAVEGLPTATSEPGSGTEELDHTGVGYHLVLGETPVPVARVVAYTVVRPA